MTAPFSFTCICLAICLAINDQHRSRVLRSDLVNRLARHVESATKTFGRTDRALDRHQADERFKLDSYSSKIGTTCRMTFLEIIFDRLPQAANEPVMREVRDGKMISVTG